MKEKRPHDILHKNILRSSFMKKLIAPLAVLVIVGVVIAFAVMPSTPAATKKLTEEIAAAQKSGKTVFLQLSSSGCVTCRKMKPAVEKIMTEYAENSSILVMNISVDSHRAIASQYAVTAVPTQVMLASNGRELFRNSGYMSYENISSVLKSVN